LTSEKVTQKSLGQILLLPFKFAPKKSFFWA
jgi:hypothetical protein